MNDIIGKIMGYSVLYGDSWWKAHRHSRQPTLHNGIDHNTDNNWVQQHHKYSLESLEEALQDEYIGCNKKKEMKNAICLPLWDVLVVFVGECQRSAPKSSSEFCACGGPDKISVDFEKAPDLYCVQY